MSKKENGQMLVITISSTRPVRFILGETSLPLELMSPDTMLDLSESAYLDESYSTTLSFDLSNPF